MAKRRGGGSKERFVNRYRTTLTSDATDSSDPGYVSWNTGMNVAYGANYKWVVLAATVQPTHDEDWLDLLAGQVWEFQLTMGTDTTFVDGADFENIAHMRREYSLTGSAGADVWDWPMAFPIPYPLPVFASTMSALCKSGTDNAAYRGVAFDVCIWYVTANISSDEITEVFAAHGAI